MWDLLWSEGSVGLGIKTVAHPPFHLLHSVGHACTQASSFPCRDVNYAKRQHENTKRGGGGVEETERELRLNGNGKMEQ